MTSYLDAYDVHCYLTKSLPCPPWPRIEPSIEDEMSIYDDCSQSRYVDDSSDERDTVMSDDHDEDMQWDSVSLLDPSDASSRLYRTVTPKAQVKAGLDEQGQQKANDGMALLNSDVMKSFPEGNTVAKVGEGTHDGGEAGRNKIAHGFGIQKKLAEPLPSTQGRDNGHVAAGFGQSNLKRSQSWLGEPRSGLSERAIEDRKFGALSPSRRADSFIALLYTALGRTQLFKLL